MKMHGFTPQTSALLAALLILTMSLPARGEPEVVGWLEGAYLQPWGVRVRAKLDTGALTSAMHAENIESYEKDGQTWVRFLFPFGRREGYPKGFVIERPLVRKTMVKSGSNTRPRYVISLDVCVSGRTQTTEFTLADRSKYHYPILLGRSSLAGRYLVDPAQTFLGKRTCPRRLAPQTADPQT